MIDKSELGFIIFDSDEEMRWWELERVKSMMYESVHNGVKHRLGVFSESDSGELIEDVKAE